MASVRELPDLDFLRECFECDPDAGTLRWKVRPRHHFKSDRGWNRTNSEFAGKLAGAVSKSTGYILVRVSYGGRSMLLPIHRVILYMATVVQPGPVVDHINGKQVDNRLINLRECTQSQNCMNKKGWSKKPHSKGVYWHKSSRRWFSQITANGVLHRLGYFKTAEDAHEAYREASARVHGDFGRVERA